jgi:Family of unknown function (DUF6116)
MIGRWIGRFAAGLRYPTLFKLLAALFVVDFFVPDVIPFFDEIVLALGTLLVGALKKKRTSRGDAAFMTGNG